MELYIDNMVIKSKKVKDHAKDIAKVFDMLDKIRMKLNPNKCTFGVNVEKFISYMISERGIEANPDKI